MKDFQAPYHENDRKTTSKMNEIVTTSSTPPEIVSPHFNGICSNFSNMYMQKCLYGGKRSM